MAKLCMSQGASSGLQLTLFYHVYNPKMNSTHRQSNEATQHHQCRAIRVKQQHTEELIHL